MILGSKLVGAVLICTLVLHRGDACSRVFYNADPHLLVSGRNIDYFSPVDPTLVITPRGVTHGNETFSWKTQYGSVVIYADNVFPMDGMNEKGLVAHTLFFTEGSQIQKNHHDKPVLGSEYWVSYLLDGNDSVEEALHSLQKVRLKGNLLPIEYDSDTKHIALEDAMGDSAIIEIINGVVTVYHSREYTVLTNIPNYSAQLKNLSLYTEKTAPTGWSSKDRFVRATYDLKRIPGLNSAPEAEGNVLAILNNVALPPNALIVDPAFLEQVKTYSQYTADPAENKGISTYWQTIANISTRTFYFKSLNSLFPVCVSLNEINFNVGQPVLNMKHLNRYPEQGLSGNIYGKMH